MRLPIVWGDPLRLLTTPNRARGASRGVRFLPRLDSSLPMRSAFEIFLFSILFLPPLTWADDPPRTEACTVPGFASLRQPTYPPGAVKDHVSGKTILLVEVRTDGSPGRISIDTSSGNEELDAAAKDQVASWRFKPSICSGKPRDSSV